MIASARSQILIVEDDEGIAELERQRLEESGHSVRVSGTAEAALEALRQARVDLILLDYRLPGNVDGLEFYTQVKATGVEPPVILVTGFSNEATVIRAMRMGVRDFVTKSLEYLDYLPEAVERVLRQVRTEHQLAESEARLASIIATATDAIIVTNDAHRITLFNSAAERMFGWKAAEAIGLPVIQMIPPDFASDHRTNGHSLGEPASLSVQIRTGTRGARRDGSEFPLEASVSRLEVGGRRYHTIMVRDITARRDAELELEKERQFLGALLQSLQSGIVACNSEGVVTLTNQAFRDLHELDESVPADRWPEHFGLFHSDGRTPLRMDDVPLVRALKGETIRDVEVLVRQGDRRFRNVFASGQPIGDRDGNTLGAVVSLQDVTEKKQLETQLRHAQRMEAIGVLAGGVAHDFNNLLTVINGYAEVVVSDPRSDSQTREFVRQIHRAGNQAAALTRQLLAFSRKQVLAPQILDLNELIREIEKMLRRLIGADILLSTSLASRLGRVKADPGQIEQVIMNLVVNARDAMPNGGHLTLETQNIDLSPSYCGQHLHVQPGPYVLLSVTDSGCGMDAATQARIFEPFFTTKGPGKGTGLGLATVHGIVQQSDGHLQVYSEVGRGTTFKIYLPRLQEDSRARTASHSLVPVAQGTETILVADDDDGVRALVRLALQSYGYTILEATEGGEALRLGLRQVQPVHLLVTDVVMPKMSGRELVQQLLPAHPNMKVLFISGYTDDAVVRHGILESGVEFLHKPFTPTTLARKVREVLDK